MQKKTQFKIVIIILCSIKKTSIFKLQIQKNRKIFYTLNAKKKI